jgi:hypothetical protein
MPVKFLQTIVRFWFFLSYLITTARLEFQVGNFKLFSYLLPKFVCRTDKNWAKINNIKNHSYRKSNENGGA